MRQARSGRTQPRRRRTRATVAALVVVVLGVPLLYGLMGAVSGLTWRPPGVPVDFTGGRQSELNDQRLTVGAVGAGTSGDATVTARVQLGGRGGHEARLGEGDWLCAPAWGCVVATSLTPEPAVDEGLTDDEARVEGAPMGTVTLVYLPPPWVVVVLLMLAGVALAGWVVRRRRAAPADDGPTTSASPPTARPNVGGAT